MPAWVLLVFAIVFEVAGTTAMKLSDGLTRLMPTLAIVVFYSMAFGALALTLKHMDVSIAYAIWAGLGTALIAMVGVFYFGEPMNWIKAVSLFLVVVGVVGLNLSD